MFIYNIIITVVVFITITALIIIIVKNNNYIYKKEEAHKKQIKKIQATANIETNKAKLVFYNEKQLLINEINDVKLLLKNEKKQKEQLQKEISNTKCLICDATSNGKHYCFSCYTKYKNRSIDIRISKCSNIEVLDYYGNKTFVCDDGRMVRSRAEALISNFLFNNNIRYIYEKPLYYFENGTTKTLHPDFYLPDYNLYIEYNELNTDNYIQSKQYALKIYQKEKLSVIVMTNKDLYDISAFLIPKLNSIKNTNFSK